MPRVVEGVPEADPSSRGVRGATSSSPRVGEGDGHGDGIAGRAGLGYLNVASITRASSVGRS